MLWKQTRWVVTCTCIRTFGQDWGCAWAGQNDRYYSTKTNNAGQWCRTSCQSHQTSRDGLALPFFKETIDLSSGLKRKSG